MSDWWVGRNENQRARFAIILLLVLHIFPLVCYVPFRVHFELTNGHNIYFRGVGGGATFWQAYQYQDLDQRCRRYCIISTDADTIYVLSVSTGACMIFQQFQSLYQSRDVQSSQNLFSDPCHRLFKVLLYVLSCNLGTPQSIGSLQWIYNGSGSLDLYLVSIQSMLIEWNIVITCVDNCKLSIK